MTAIQGVSKLILTGLLLTIVVTLSGCGGGGGGGDNPTSTGTIIGRTVMEGALIEISGVLVTSGSRSTTTGADGRFTLTNVPAGWRSITFSKTGYETKTVQIYVTANLTYDMGDITLVDQPPPPP